ncbi:fibronectin type III domain-containing protein [Actinoplanes sp. NPDC049118]|uniref:fibronectin type III domain-containing protein n=1 Tax=Actinoplanes sp. NPDC049118 TaxID=3155769 RepID=UPI003405228E
MAHAAAPAAPKSFTVGRATDDVRKINVSWKPVTGADHYVVESIAGNVESVINVPSSALSYTLDAPDACSSYKIRVGAADADGNTSSTTYWTVKSLAPTYISGVTNGREDDGTTAWESWKAPSWAGESPLTGYHVVFSRVSDGGVIADETITDTTFRYKGVDPARAYNIAVSTVNAYGQCTPAKSTIDRFRPAEVTDLVVQRRADAASTVEVLWKPATNGPTPAYYLISYGQDKITSSLKVDATATKATLNLDAAKSWMIEVKAYNANGGSNAVSGSVPVWKPSSTPAPVTPPTSVPAPGATPSTPASSAPAPADPSAAPGTPGEPGTDSSTTTTTVTTGSDRTPPTITTTLSQASKNGWFRSAVTIHFNCADSDSAIATCPADVVADKDGYGLKFSGTAVDKAGNTATITQALSIDQTPPTVTAKVTGTKSAEGWYTAAPSIHYTCTDTVSGYNTVNVCPTDTTVTSDGVNQKITGTAWDKAGNSATDSVIINLDRTLPVIKASVIGGDANADGWYTTAPTVHFTCTDTGSGLATCPADVKVTTNGAGQKVTGTAVDKAGNASTATISVNVDLVGREDAAVSYDSTCTLAVTKAASTCGVKFSTQPGTRINLPDVFDIKHTEYPEGTYWSTQVAVTVTNDTATAREFRVRYQDVQDGDRVWVERAIFTDGQPGNVVPAGTSRVMVFDVWYNAVSDSSDVPDDLTLDFGYELA